MIEFSKKASTDTKRQLSAVQSGLSTVLMSFGFGLACFLITEIMHTLLVPDIGRDKERWLAEAIAALVVSGLTAKLVSVMRREHQATLARMQVIAEINHHIRNALMAITASVYAVENEQCLGVISDCVERIDWALREVLPREQPLPKEERERLMFYRYRSAAGSRENR